MKKFFKVLSLVLALTLIFGTIPASAAVTINAKKSKTLYVGEKRGSKTVDGEVTTSKYQSTVTYAKLLGITKAEAKELGVTAEVSDTDILKRSNKGMKVRAIGIGDATVTLTADGKLYNVTITGKKTAEEVWFGQDFIETDKTFYAGKTYKLSLPRTVAGEKKDTDNRRLVIYDADGTVVYGGEKDDTSAVVATPDPEKPRLWTVKFVKAGTFTVEGQAFQSKNYPDTTASTKVEIEVKVPELTNVEQVELNKIKLTFDGDADVVDMSTFAAEDIFYKVADTEVPFSLIKDGGVKVAEDKQSVSVEVYTNFKGGETYYVRVGEVVKSFVASGTAATDIVDFKIKTTSVVFNESKEIEYQFLNKEGIDITKANPSLIPTFELTSGNENEVIVAGTTIYFYEKNKTAQVKGTVTTDLGNEANGYKPTVLDCTGTIISVDKAQDSLAEISYSFQASLKADQSDMGSNHEYAIGDSVNLYILFKIAKADGSGTYYHTLADEQITDVRVADENFLMVTDIKKTGGDSYVTVTGIKEGAATILLYKDNGQGQNVAVQALPVTVKAKRAASSLELKVSKNTMNINYAEDAVTLTLTVLDQYKDKIAVAPTLEQTTASKDFATVSGLTFTEKEAGVYECTLKPANLTKGAKFVAGTPSTVVFTAKVGDKASNSAGFSFDDKSGVALAYLPNVDATALDTTVKLDTKASVGSFTVDMLAAGYAAGKVGDLTFINQDNIKDGTGAGLKDHYAFTITLGSTVLKAADLEASNIIVSATGASITAVSGSGAALDKAKAGNYIFTLYKIGEDGTKKTYQSVGQRTIVVSDAQTQPTVVRKNDTTNRVVSNPLTDADKVGIAYDTLTVKFGDKEAKAGEAVDIVAADIEQSSNGSFYINSVTVRIKNANLNGYIELKKDVGIIINGSNK